MFLVLFTSNTYAIHVQEKRMSMEFLSTSAFYQSLSPNKLGENISVPITAGQKQYPFPLTFFILSCAFCVYKLCGSNLVLVHRCWLIKICGHVCFWKINERKQ